MPLSVAVRCRRWYAKNKADPAVLEKARRRAREYYHANKSDPGFLTRRRAQHLRRRYGLTEAQFVEIWERQDGKCALCSCALKLGRGRDSAQIDHDHETDRVRGLLCMTCNTTLGRYERWDKAKLEAFLCR